MKLLRKWYWLTPLLPVLFLVCSIVWQEPMLLFLSVALTACIYYMARLRIFAKREVEDRDAKGKDLR